MSENRLTELYQQRLKNTHLFLLIDDEMVLVQRHLTIAKLKEQVMIRNNHDRDQARLWHLWLGEHQLPEDKTVYEVFQAFQRSKLAQSKDLMPLRYGSGGSELKQTETVNRRIRLTEQITRYTLLIKKYPAIVGRKDNNDVTVDMNVLEAAERNTISRRHAEIRAADDHFSVRNLSQHNLVMVDDQQIDHNKTAALMPGSVLRLGKVSFEVDVEEV